MHRPHRRLASRVCASAAMLAICAAAPAAAQVPAPTTPVGPQETVSTGAPIAPNGTENVATPGANECYARLFKPKDVPEVLVSEDTVVAQYRLRCSSDVTGYTFGFNRQVVSTETEIFPTFFPGNAVIPDEAFNCAGDFPGWGLACTGTYKGRFSTIRGLVSFQLSEEEIAAKLPFCKLLIGGTTSTFTSTVSRDPYTNKALVNKDGTSQIRHLAAGPFRVTTPACHRGASTTAEPAKQSKSKKNAKAKTAKAKA